MEPLVGAPWMQLKNQDPPSASVACKFCVWQHMGWGGLCCSHLWEGGVMEDWAGVLKVLGTKSCPFLGVFPADTVAVGPLPTPGSLKLGVVLGILHGCRD